MEDIFTILIYLFIIISFFSSFFKKKEKPKPPVQTRRAPDSDEEFAGENPAQRYEGKSILTEIENLFKEDYEDEKPLPQVDPPVAEQTPKTSERKTKLEQKTYGEHTRTASEHTFQTNWEAQKKQLEERKKRIDATLGAQAESMEKVLSLKKEEEVDRFAVQQIREKLAHPQHLYEYLIIGEILQRPKSLRR